MTKPVQKAASFLTVGDRLRARRKALKVPLRAVAEGTGLSIGFISQVERGVCEPSLTSLTAITKELGVSVSDILPELSAVPEATRTLSRRRHQLRPSDTGTHSYERITTTFPGSTLTGVLIHEPPGVRVEPQSHEGEEMFFMLRGSITVELDGRAVVLAEGDTLHFSSRRRHATWNHTPEPAVMLHVCTMDVFGDQISDDALGVHAGHQPFQKDPET
ncbi:helix-turn-helix domain-containing protein [Alloyangia pacifica]|uniref:helix-turn-helix domain-containing protein n=1 Tax=Alloyangia pacifica TaxID=311180 RepID=UPI001CFE5EA7|nr:cupin domain-containing protein [Alloyangia pacifica]